MPGEFDIHGGITISGPDLPAFENFIKGKWKAEFKKEINRATARGAKYILSEIRGRILAKQYAPNALMTAQRKGYKTVEDAIPLVDTGGLIRESLQAERRKAESELVYAAWEVGVIGNKPSRRTGAPANKYVRVLHEGATFTVEINGRSRTFRIPPRPFLRSVWEDPAVQARVQKEWSDTVRSQLIKHGKL